MEKERKENTSVEPIHCLEPTNDAGLSPILTRHS